MGILDLWLRDMPQQFLGQPKIEALIKAFAKQLQEVEDVFARLDEATDLETAEGRNLDYIGTIVPLTRKEAGLLAGSNNPVYVIEDNRYRQYLKYQRLANTSECTYPDILEGVKMFWDGPVRFTEPEDQPAYFRIDVDIEDTDRKADTLMRVPVIRSAGVGAGIHAHLPERENALHMGGRGGVIVRITAGYVTTA